MTDSHTHRHQKTIGLHRAIIALLGILCLIGGWYLRDFSQKLDNANSEITTLTDQKNKSDVRIIELEGNFLAAVNKNNELREIIDGNKKDLEDITKTVGDLQKLSQTDPQLLEKYSKVYFLNEHYVPEKLTYIDQDYVYNNAKLEQMHTDVWPHLRSMLQGAESAGIKLKVASAYRSFEQQITVKENHKTVFGSGANKFSADQGFSEHQLGTSVDLLMSNSLNPFEHFEGTSGFQWLEENAYKYGFVLSYPKNNAYYEFEPWHWRFVGRRLAQELHDREEYFYDMDQRDINKYLIDFFD